MNEVVNYVTGEIVTEAEVDASIARVIQHAESIWDEWAWQVENRTWLIKGYASWDEMRQAVYTNLNGVTAPRAERPELVARFRAAGLTQQETAVTLGVTGQTIYNDERKVRDPKYLGSPEPDDIVDAELVEDDEPPVNRSPRRQPLPDAARSAGWELAKAVERIERITADDRFAANKEQVAPHLRSHLTNAIEVFQDLLDRIDN